MYKTFNGWKLAGRVVEAGQRGVYRNEYGDMMFHVSQTLPRGKQVTIYYDNLGRRVRREVQY